jgi:hypothetical protein
MWWDESEFYGRSVDTDADDNGDPVTEADGVAVAGADGTKGAPGADNNVSAVDNNVSAVDNSAPVAAGTRGAAGGRGTPARSRRCLR